jgi:RimJ/RimL family protein N-acetyltransferase
VITDKGKGYGRQALRLIKQLTFDHLLFHRLALDVKVHNARARSLYTCEGFVEEGILRDRLKSDQGYESLVLMSMLASEYSTQIG